MPRLVSAQLLDRQRARGSPRVLPKQVVGLHGVLQLSSGVTNIPGREEHERPAALVDRLKIGLRKILAQSRLVVGFKLVEVGARLTEEPSRRFSNGCFALLPRLALV